MATTIRFVGGPIDGRTMTKESPGRSPIYRDLDGEKIPVQRGDRIVRRTGGALYLRETRPSGVTYVYKEFPDVS